jgi:hypothetical protein
VGLPKLYLKDCVHVNGAHFYPETVRIVNAARATAPPLTDGAVWVTSANDSTHGVGSLHYKNRAFDIRTKNIDGDEKVKAQEWVARMKLALGNDYDIIFERDHIHCEFDPKETP